MTNDIMLTTVDNPYDPFDNFDKWYEFDMAKGYNSCGYLARIVRTSDNLSDADQDLDIVNAIEEIVRINPLGVWRKVEKSDEARE